jgi:hypothetical protein
MAQHFTAGGEIWVLFVSMGSWECYGSFLPDSGGFCCVVLPLEVHYSAQTSKKYWSEIIMKGNRQSYSYSYPEDASGNGGIAPSLTTSTIV